MKHLFVFKFLKNKNFLFLYYISINLVYLKNLKYNNHMKRNINALYYDLFGSIYWLYF